MNPNCLVPLFSSTVLTEIGSRIIGAHSFANKTFSTLYNPEHKSGIIAKTSKCIIDYTYKFFNNIPSNKGCEDSSTIIDMVDKNPIIKPEKIINGTTNIFGQEYNVANSGESYSTLTLDNIVEFLGLQDCSVESILESLNQYAISLIPTTTTTTTTTTSTTTTTTTELPTTTENFSTPTYFDNNESSCLTPENILIATGIGLAGIVIGGALGYFMGRYTNKKLQSKNGEFIKDYIKLQHDNKNLEDQVKALKNNIYEEPTHVNIETTNLIGSDSIQIAIEN